MFVHNMFSSRRAGSLVVLNLMNCWGNTCCALMPRPKPGSDDLRVEIGSHLFNLSSKLVFCFAQSFLEAPQKLVLFAFGKRQIVVSQLTIFLFQFALYFVPAPFQLQLHSEDSSCIKRRSALCFQLTAAETK
jgi:hypothetical protein